MLLIIQAPHAITVQRQQPIQVKSTIWACVMSSESALRRRRWWTNAANAARASGDAEDGSCNLPNTSYNSTCNVDSPYNVSPNVNYLMEEKPRGMLSMAAECLLPWSDCTYMGKPSNLPTFSCSCQLCRIAKSLITWKGDKVRILAYSLQTSLLTPDKRRRSQAHRDQAQNSSELFERGQN